MNKKVAVKVDDLTVAYNYKPVLWDIDLEIPEGVLMAIVGPNGVVHNGENEGIGWGFNIQTDPIHVTYLSYIP